MNLLFYHYNLQAGGAERTIALLANYAVQQGDQVTVLLMDEACPSFYTLDNRIRQIHMNTARHSRNKKEAIKNNLHSLRCVKNVLRECNPDAVICFDANTILHTWLTRSAPHCRLIGSERANPLKRPKNIWRIIRPWLSAKCDGFLFQTTGARSCYPQSTQSKSVILQNTIDVQAFERADMPWNSRSGICAVGRMDAGKCFDDLLRAFSVVHQKFPDAQLDLYGDGPERVNLENLANALGLCATVTFYGPNQQIISEYAKHKMFIMMSQMEGMPNVLLEAMASGCACIYTDCDFGPSDLIRDGENGFLVPIHDINAAADRLCRLLEDDQLSRRFGEAAKRIRETNSVKKIGETFRAYVQQILS